MNSLIVYRKKDPVVANAALKSIQNHGWYLSEELVPLILFSKTVPYSIKQETVSKDKNSYQLIVTAVGLKNQPSKNCLKKQQHHWLAL